MINRTFVYTKKHPHNDDVFIVFCVNLFVIIDFPMSMYRKIKYKSFHPPAGNMTHEESFYVKFDQRNIGPINLRWFWFKIITLIVPRWLSSVTFISMQLWPPDPFGQVSRQLVTCVYLNNKRGYYLEISPRLVLLKLVRDEAYSWCSCFIFAVVCV